MDKMEAKFTVVIPSFNRRKTIMRAINSVLNQTYTSIQLIVVDDGSEDGTDTFIKEHVNDKRLSYYMKNHEGAQQARNFGLEHADGDFVLFLDSDDELMPTCIEEMYNCFSLDKDLGAVYVLTGLRSTDGELKIARNDYLEGNVYKEVLQQGYLTSTSFISMRREIFQKIGSWDCSFPACQDDDMCFRIAKHYKIALIKKVLGIYGMDTENHIGHNSTRVAMGWWILWKKYAEDISLYCGIDILRERYEECAKRFKEIGLQEECESVKNHINGLSNGQV